MKLMTKKVPKTLKTGLIAAVVLVCSRFCGPGIKFFTRDYFVLALSLGYIMSVSAPGTNVHRVFSICILTSNYAAMW